MQKAFKGRGVFVTFPNNGTWPTNRDGIGSPARFVPIELSRHQGHRWAYASGGNPTEMTWKWPENHR